MDDSILKGKWKEISGEILTQWGKITDSDLQQTKGNTQSIIGLIEQKYGHAKEEIMNKLHQISESFKDQAGDAAVNSTDATKQKLRQ